MGTPNTDMLSGGFGLAGQFANLATNIAMQGWQNQANARLAAQANQWNIEQWQRQNEYNSPGNQLARLRAAGINPALAMAGGASSMLSGQIADPIHPANVPQTTTPPYNSIDPLLLSQVELNRSAARKNDADANEKESGLPLYLKNLQATYDNLNKDLDVKTSTIQKMDNESFYILQKNAREGKYLDNDIARLLNETSVSDAQVKKLLSAVGLDSAQVRYYSALANLSENELKELQETWLLRQRGVQLKYGEGGYYDKLLESLGYDNDLKRFDLSNLKVIFGDNPDGSETSEGVKFAMRLGFLIKQLLKALPVVQTF